MLEEEVRELEDWILDRDRAAPIDDGSIFYQDQLRERLELYQVRSFSSFSSNLIRCLRCQQRLQTELNLKEHSVRHLVDQIRQDGSQSSQSAENLVSSWSNLQKKVDTKVSFYTDLFRLHEEFKGMTIASRPEDKSDTNPLLT